jgi:hypothetical protein
MTLQRMDNVGIVVDDLDAAIACFRRTWHGAGRQSRSRASGRTAPVGLDGVRIRQPEE